LLDSFDLPVNKPAVASEAGRKDEVQPPRPQ